jgi:2-keto-3-deoxy-L-rhamnonate aldolase RhmA
MTSLRQRLLRGAKSYGPVIMSDSPIVAEMLAMTGYDHMVCATSVLCFTLLDLF